MRDSKRRVGIREEAVYEKEGGETLSIGRGGMGRKRNYELCKNDPDDFRVSFPPLLAPPVSSLKQYEMQMGFRIFSKLSQFLKTIYKPFRLIFFVFSDV